MEKLPQFLAVKLEAVGKTALNMSKEVRNGQSVYLKMTNTNGRTLYGRTLYGRTLYVYTHGGAKIGWVPSENVPDWVEREATYVARTRDVISDADSFDVIMATWCVSAEGLLTDGRPKHYAPSSGILLNELSIVYRTYNTILESHSMQPRFATPATPENPSTPATPATTKETTMNTIPAVFSRAITATKDAAAEAAFLEAGRIANNKLAAVAASKMPMMLRGYAATPVGKVVIAVLVENALREFRPKDLKLQRLSQAMTTSAMQEALRSMDIEGFINSVLDTDEVKLAMTKLTDSEPAATPQA